MPSPRSSQTLLLDELQHIASRQTTVSQRSSQEKDDDTRQEVARKFVRYYFGLLIGIILIVPIYNLGSYALFHDTALLIPFKDAILTYSAVVGPTFGLVVAYYFKTADRS